MNGSGQPDVDDLETLIGRWRSSVGADSEDIDELESRLRSQADELSDIGLAPEEVFLVAARRVGISYDHDRGGDSPETQIRRSPGRSRDFLTAAGLACLAGIAIKAPELFGLGFDGDSRFYARSLSVLVLPMLAAYFALKRRLDARTTGIIAALFAAGAVAANVYPFDPDSQTEILTALHLPIALWLLTGVAHTGGQWRTQRMEYVRFTGEWGVYYALIAAGGGLFAALTAGVFGAIGIDLENFTVAWLLPCGASGAVVVAAWLTESRPRVAEIIASALTTLFTPLVAAMLLIFVGVMAVTGRSIELDRDALIFFNVLLASILALVVYSVSARHTRPRLATFMLLAGALLIDVVVFVAVALRIAEFGITPNRAAVAGENLILLANLVGSVWLYLRCLRQKRPTDEMMRWQGAFLPVYAAWAALVVVAFPPVFGFA